MNKYNIKNAIRIFADILGVPKCAACGECLSVEYKLPLCEKCMALWRSEISDVCKICGKRHSECECVPHIEGASACSDYMHIVGYDSVSGKAMILKLKGIEDWRIYEFLGKEIADNIRGRLPRFRKPPLVANVPRSENSVKRYGHDQAKLIAMEFSKNMGYEYANVLVHRGSVKQKTLSKSERSENAESSYTINERYADKVKGRSVILIDDVITTGSTVCACAKWLKNYGASAVYAVSVARVCGFY